MNFIDWLRYQVERTDAVGEFARSWTTDRKRPMRIYGLATVLEYLGRSEERRSQVPAASAAWKEFELFPEAFILVKGDLGNQILCVHCIMGSFRNDVPGTAPDIVGIDRERNEETPRNAPHHLGLGICIDCGAAAMYNSRNWTQSLLCLRCFQRAVPGTCSGCRFPVRENLGALLNGDGPLSRPPLPRGPGWPEWLGLRQHRRAHKCEPDVMKIEGREKFIFRCREDWERWRDLLKAMGLDKYEPWDGRETTAPPRAAQ